MGLKTPLGKRRILEKIKGLLESGHGSGAGQRLCSHGPGRLEAIKLSLSSAADLTANAASNIS